MSSPDRPRRLYIDWFRGVAVVIMIFAHTMDAWTRPEDRDGVIYGLTVKIAGMGAPLFLFLAGVAVALAAGAGVRAGKTPWEAAARVRRRGLEIFGLAFLFRLQAWLLSPGATLTGLLKVDILNIMGPSIVMAAVLWGLSARAAGRIALLATAATAFSLVTPFVRASAGLAVLPDPIEWYVRPPPGRSWFAMFPWAGLLLAGTVIGEFMERERDDRAGRTVLSGLAVGGAALLMLALAASYVPSPFGNTYFWTTSSSYFFLRIGLMTFLLALGSYWTRRFAADRFSPMVQLGRTSLFIYWIHVEIVYGILTYPLHRNLPIGWALVAFVLFTGLMLWASVSKDRLVRRWKTQRGVRAASPAV